MNPLRLDILPQPTDSTCGPTCLHAVYRYFGDGIPLEQVIREVGQLEQGGTLAVVLGSHALRRGYSAKIYTYDLNLFDPTWFAADSEGDHHASSRRSVPRKGQPSPALTERLRRQAELKQSSRLRWATDAYLDFLEWGGEVRMEVLTIDLIRRYLKRETPILTGLSATFLYGESRERPAKSPSTDVSSVPDDVWGLPVGHFVVLCGYDRERRTVFVADPLESNPIARDQVYAVDIDRVFSAIMLGIVTYDANLLIVRPRRQAGVTRQASAHRQ
jgi:hypothetical protein